MRPFRAVIFKLALCVYSAIFKTPSYSVSDSVSIDEVQESALLNANPECSDAGSSSSDWNGLKHNPKMRK